MNDFENAKKSADKFQIIDAIKILESIAQKKSASNAFRLLADLYYLSADPERAAKNLLSAFEIEQDPDLYSKFLFMKNYRLTDPIQTRLLAERFGRFYRNSQQIKFKKSKKIRVGFVSPDFREHAVANFLSPIFKLDSKKFSTFIYSTGAEDFITKKFRRNKVEWKNFHNRDHVEIFEAIRRDSIDILVDLAGHSQNNLLNVFGFRAASVQISMIGYTATTGLETMDYFLSDEICGESIENFFTEKIVRMKKCHLCYKPIKTLPPVEKVNRDYISFGSFNNFSKVTDEILIAWKEILNSVLNSKLVIKSKICSIPDGRKILLERLSRLDLPVDRIEMRPYSQDYLEQYRDIDIMLDTFPYTGGLTTCESLSMGVPVVTIRGSNHGSRISSSILTNTNLPELISKNVSEYIQKSIELANDPDRIKNYRATLREKIFNSPITDSKQYARNLEEVFCKILEEKF